jgi:hypothetical protein
MTTHRDPLADRLTRLPNVDPGAPFVERVRKRSHAELSPPRRRSPAVAAAPRSSPFPNFRLAIATGLVPALLISAAAVRIVETVRVVATISDDRR